MIIYVTCIAGAHSTVVKASDSWALSSQGSWVRLPHSSRRSSGQTSHPTLPSCVSVSMCEWHCTCAEMAAVWLCVCLNCFNSVYTFKTVQCIELFDMRYIRIKISFHFISLSGQPSPEPLKNNAVIMYLLVFHTQSIKNICLTSLFPYSIHQKCNLIEFVEKM